MPCIRLTNIGATALAQRSMRPAHWAAIPSIQRWKPFIQKAFFRDALRQRSDAAHPVPLGQCIHISKERVIVFQAFRMEQAAHILIPAIDAMTVRFQAQGVQGTLSHYLIRCVRPLPLRAIFGLFRQHVETELIVFPQVVLQTVLHLPVIRSLFFFPFIRRRASPCFAVAVSPFHNLHHSITFRIISFIMILLFFLVVVSTKIAH